LAAVGFSTFHHRAKVDVSLPLFAMVEYSPTQRHRPAAERDHLLTFRGTRSNGSDQMRRHLWKIHNNADVLVVCACRWLGEDRMSSATGYDGRCVEDEAAFAKYNYTDLATNTKFSLIVEGFGYHSFRLTEAMGAGSIPVILVDHYVLPFQSILDWDAFSIRLPEHRLFELHGDRIE
jgi:hypothetical protein